MGLRLGPLKGPLGLRLGFKRAFRGFGGLKGPLGPLGVLGVFRGLGFRVLEFSGPWFWGFWGFRGLGFRAFQGL